MLAFVFSSKVSVVNKMTLKYLEDQADISLCKYLNMRAVFMVHWY